MKANDEEMKMIIVVTVIEAKTPSTYLNHKILKLKKFILQPSVYMLETDNVGW